MPTEYLTAEAAAKIGQRRIKSDHQSLARQRIEFVFIKKEDKEGMPQFVESKGKRILGKAKVISGLNAFLAREEDDDREQFGVVEICYHSWRVMKEPAREALIDHELCHFVVDIDTGKLSTITHDVEEFNQVIKRHGLWKNDVLRFTELAAKHLPLLDAAENEASNTATLSRVEDDGTETPIISINTDKKCSRCSKKGATQNGMCMSCTTKAMNNGEFDKEIKGAGSISKAVRKVHSAVKGQ
jgi:putative metallopeptidase